MGDVRTVWLAPIAGFAKDTILELNDGIDSATCSGRNGQAPAAKGRGRV